MFVLPEKKTYLFDLIEHLAVFLDNIFRFLLESSHILRKIYLMPISTSPCF